MQLVVNGDARTLDGVSTVAELVRQFDLTPERVAVEVNEQLVRRANYDQMPLKDGDRVEIVTLVGGG